MEKARSGDTIRVTKAFDEPYSIGDILEVDQRQAELWDCDDDQILTTEGYILTDGNYKIVNAATRIVGHYTDVQIEEVKALYKRACLNQSAAPFEQYDATEIQTILNVTRVLGIHLDV